MNDSDTATESLHPNHRYLIHWMRETCADGGTPLDYGCGDGKVVMAARAAGVDAYGAETYYEGMRTRDIEATREADPAARYIHTITDNQMDFPDANFDIVTANMVFEHVHDLEGTLREIHRVLKPNAVLLALFPTIGVLREGHLSMPLIHWLPRNRFPGGRLVAHAVVALGAGMVVLGRNAPSQSPRPE
jgi:SAM-dependent methyltransferase